MRNSQRHQAAGPSNQADAGQWRNLAELAKREPQAVVQLKNMTPSWNVGQYSGPASSQAHSLLP